MKVIKRNSSEVTFDISKIITAITKANEAVEEDARLTPMQIKRIAEAVELSQSAISHQLRILKQMHLIKYRREGKNLLYSLADDHVKTILQMGLEHVLE